MATDATPTAAALSATVAPAASGVDCVIPAHEKDFETLGESVGSILRCCPEVQRIFVVSRSPWEGAAAIGAEWISEDEACWPFRLSDLEGCGCSPGWLLQQLLKLHAPLVLPGLSDNVLVCDADVIWLPCADGVRFISESLAEAAFACVFDAEGCPPIRSAVDLHRYDEFVPAVLPGLEKPQPGKETAVCHHALLQREVLQTLFGQVEAAHAGKPFWRVFLEACQACGGRASEYELYHAYAAKHFAERLVLRRLPFAVVGDLAAAFAAPPEGAQFLVAHSHLRGLSSEELEDREGVINGNIALQVAQRLLKDKPPELAALLAGSGMF